MSNVQALAGALSNVASNKPRLYRVLANLELGQQDRELAKHRLPEMLLLLVKEVDKDKQLPEVILVEMHQLEVKVMDRPLHKERVQQQGKEQALGLLALVRVRLLVVKEVVQHLHQVKGKQVGKDQEVARPIPKVVQHLPLAQETVLHHQLEVAQHKAQVREVDLLPQHQYQEHREDLPEDPSLHLSPQLRPLQSDASLVVSDRQKQACVRSQSLTTCPCSSETNAKAVKSKLVTPMVNACVYKLTIICASDMMIFQGKLLY